MIKGSLHAYTLHTPSLISIGSRIGNANLIATLARDWMPFCKIVLILSFFFFFFSLLLSFFFSLFTSVTTLVLRNQFFPSPLPPSRAYNFFHEISAPAANMKYLWIRLKRECNSRVMHNLDFCVELID